MTMSLTSTEGHHHTVAGNFSGATVVKIEKEIGRGNSATVYLVRVNGVECAMKVCEYDADCLGDSFPDSVVETKTQEDILSRHNELKVLQRLGHGFQGGEKAQENPFIVRLIHADLVRDQVRTFLEYCENGDLFSVMQTHGNLFTPKGVATFSAQIASALNYLHQCNVLYVDLKPENVVVTKDLRLKLTDFGLSVILDNNDDEDIIIGQGTLHYSSPEVFHRMPYTFASDWWSFGILLYEMLFQELPFSHGDEEETDQDVCRKICAQDVPFPPGDRFDFAGFELASMFLVKDPSRRLKDFHQIMAHDFFDNVDLDGLENA